MSRSGRESLQEVREALLDVRELSGDPPGCPGVVIEPHGYPGDFGRPFRMSGSRRESLPDVRGGRETLPDVWGGQEALTDVWKWLGVLPGCSRVVGRRSQMSRSGRIAPPDVQGWSKGSPA